jgi:hypothetical protein
MIDMKDWLVMPQRGRPQQLDEDQSYPKLLELIEDLEKERGHLLTDKQVDALRAVLLSLIDVGARVSYYE